MTTPAETSTELASYQQLTLMSIVKLTAARTLRQLYGWGVLHDAEELLGLADMVEALDPVDGFTCPMCQELECDDDCPLALIRANLAAHGNLSPLEKASEWARTPAAAWSHYLSMPFADQCALAWAVNTHRERTVAAAVEQQERIQRNYPRMSL